MIKMYAWVKPLLERVTKDRDEELIKLKAFSFIKNLSLPLARCAFFGRNLHSRMPLVPTPARLKLLHACDQ
jgi:hypothetical protein